MGNTAHGNPGSQRSALSEPGRGQCDQEATAFRIHRTAHPMSKLPIPAGINPPSHVQGFPGRCCLANANPKAASGLLGSTGSRHVGVQVCVCQGWNTWEP